mgnify:CR=1 FL=1
MDFELVSAYQPTGDQPEAIRQLVEGVNAGITFQTLLGVTGSGKTFTMANVIQHTQKPTLIVSHNKTLVAQLYGEFKHFKTLFAWLMERARTKNFTLIIDEFQEFQSVNAAVFSEMQAIWDLQHKACQMNLICCGSVYALMTRIFENAKEPLFGRANQRMHLKAFDVATLEEILQDHAPGFSNEDLLALYLLSGGVAKYVELFMQQQATTKEAMLDLLLAEDSLFLEEGKNVLIDEFGKDNYIVNLGHGILPNIPVDHAKAFIEAVKEYKS